MLGNETNPLRNAVLVKGAQLAVVLISGLLVEVAEVFHG